jgi:dynein heavy chain
VRRVYEAFKPNLPLINDLRNPNLRASHWQRINNAIRLFNETAVSEWQEKQQQQQ